MLFLDKILPLYCLIVGLFYFVLCSWTSVVRNFLYCFCKCYLTKVVFIMISLVLQSGDRWTSSLFAPLLVSCAAAEVELLGPFCNHALLLPSSTSSSSPSPPGLNFGKLRKKENNCSPPLAIVASWSSRHILWQYFDSYVLEVRKKRKVKGCRGEGGWRAVTDLSRSLCHTAEGSGSVSLPGRCFEDTPGPGPRFSWLFVSPIAAGPLSASALQAPRPSGGPAAVSGVVGGPGCADWTVSYSKFNRSFTKQKLLREKSFKRVIASWKRSLCCCVWSAQTHRLSVWERKWRD